MIQMCNYSSCCAYSVQGHVAGFIHLSILSFSPPLSLSLSFSLAFSLPLSFPPFFSFFQNRFSCGLHSVFAEDSLKHLILLPLHLIPMCGCWLLKRKSPGYVFKQSFPDVFSKQPCLEIAVLEMGGWRQPSVSSVVNAL